MRESEVVEIQIGDGYTLRLAGISRDRTGILQADGSIVNGTVRHVERVILNDPNDCAAWATRVSERTALLADTLQTCLRNAYLDAVAMLQDSSSAESGKAARVVELVNGWEYFHDGSTAYAAIPIDTGGIETLPLNGKPFKRRLSGLYYRETGDVLSGETVGAAILTLEARAFEDGEERPVFIRVAGDLETVWFDLADDGRHVVRIDTSGWTITTACPHAFYRPDGMHPAPAPVAGSDLFRLRELVNLNAEQDWRLLIAWLVSTLHPLGPYPVLILQGEQGSAKTMTARVIRALIDPIAGEVRPAPRNEEDLLIAATRCRILALDNLSGVKPQLSDALCRLATYGTLAKRQLYSDADEVVLTARCPIILTGIDVIATRGDLQDRSFVLDLPAIPDAKRRPEAELVAAFERAHPALLGALFDAVSMALRNHDSTSATGYPRMADAARWIVAAEPALPWPRGEFLAAYAGNRAQGVHTALEASPIWPALHGLLANNGPWEGTAAPLLAALEQRVDEATRRRHGWPGSPAALTNQLKRLAPDLRRAGIECDQLKRTNAGAPWHLERVHDVDTIDTIDTFGPTTPILRNGTASPSDDTSSSLVTTPSPLNWHHDTIYDDGDDTDDGVRMDQEQQEELAWAEELGMLAPRGTE